MSRIANVATFSSWWYYLKYWPKYNCSNFPLPLYQPFNQFGFFTRKVMSGMCISTTRDPSTESIQNSFLRVTWSSAFKSYVAYVIRLAPLWISASLLNGPPWQNKVYLSLPYLTLRVQQFLFSNHVRQLSLLHWRT